MKALKFIPILKTPLWGGRDIVTLKGLSQPQFVGESWEVSSLSGDETRVAEGENKGQTLKELIRVYGADFLGLHNLQRFGEEFPLLVKFLSSDRDLSLQVHPDNEMARRRAGETFGKTEMWYFVDVHPGAEIYCGFNKTITLDEYDRLMEEGRFTEALARYETHPGDSFFIPAGQIHCIGSGNFIIEIQQSCDITYRIYDFDRLDDNGNKRELHTALAKEALKFEERPQILTPHFAAENTQLLLKRSEEFTASLYHLTKSYMLDHSSIDSFVILVAFEGKAFLTDASGDEIILKAGETVLYPAVNGHILVRPAGGERFSFIETYVE